MKYIQDVRNGAVHVLPVIENCDPMPLFSVVFNGSFYYFDGVRVIQSSQPPADANEAREFLQACISAIDYANMQYFLNSGKSV